MKTSNKLLLAGVMLVIGYLIIYDFSLRAEYLKGDYKSRFYKMRHVDIDGFTAITNNLGNIADVRIEQGPKSGVWLSERENGSTVVTKKDKTISIDFEKGKPSSTVEIIIICPTLKNVNIADRDVKDVKTNNEERYYNGNNTRISGFKTDSLNIKATGRALIALYENTITNLHAQLSDGSVRLNIGPDNKIVNGNFNIQDNARFEMREQVVEHPVYNFGSNAEIQLSGKSFHEVKP